MIVNGIEWSDEDIRLVEKFEEIRNRGLYVDGKTLTDVYNRLLGKRVNVTNCGSCLRLRIQELAAALNHAKEKEAQEAEKAKQLEEDNKPEKKVSKKKK